MKSLARSFDSPVKARFTLEYFDRIPDLPGLYWFTGTRSQILFVGKTRNLHKHLLSFRELSSERCNSYLYELLKQISNIHWQPMTDNVQLHALEKQRIEKDQPLYNRRDPLSRESHIYIGLTWTEQSLAAGIHRSLQELPYDQVYGPFKKPVFTHRAFTALLRCLWTASQSRPTNEAPAPLLKPLAPPFQNIELGPNMKLWRPLVESYLLGAGQKLVSDFEREFQVRMKSQLDRFCCKCLVNDLNQLESFFKYGPDKIHHLKLDFPLPIDRLRFDWPNPLFS